MTDKITIERETLQQLHDELDTVEYDADPPKRVLVMMDKLRAALAAQPAVKDSLTVQPPADARQEPVACKGIPRKGCNYLAYADTVCNKCGEVHRHHQMLAHFYAAQPTRPARMAKQEIDMDDDDQYDDDQYDDEPRESQEFGCCLPPGECVMPGLHFPSECHTAADYEREHGADWRATPPTKETP